MPRAGEEIERAPHGVGVERRQSTGEGPLLEAEGRAISGGEHVGIRTVALDVVEEPEPERDGATAQRLAAQHALSLRTGTAGFGEGLARARATRPAAMAVAMAKGLSLLDGFRH